ncbi:CYTH and CHAD domain-containing protein [Amycolatopsis mongoliensis]|uniref:CYTH and CHAD domain-containing protein n=1 Tax=Amycolatopsis mongoliensis TaxID=715475 RepID=A0A9Y2K021_9PSEU|nr:CYTH and CHAD domain-containing protein [Amycolatopsis sp. 4-36]WIY06667.1 CYTH and CHAD domain-containing protein [Amycolatopsis sp. 4-36]
MTDQQGGRVGRYFPFPAAPGLSLAGTPGQGRWARVNGPSVATCRHVPQPAAMSPIRRKDHRQLLQAFRPQTSEATARSVADMREEELKFSVNAEFVLPALATLAPQGGAVVRAGTRRLSATYYDSADLRLARSGVTLRHRTGEDGPPWHLKLPTGTANVREELTAAGPAGEPPPELTRLVTGWLRTAALVPVVSLDTLRDTWEIRGRTGETLVELVDDTVTVRDGRETVDRFRELEVERKARGDVAAAAMRRAARLLTDAGARGGEFVPKAIRALGPKALEPSDITPPGTLGHRPTGGEVVTRALRRTVVRMIDYDVRVRRLEPDAVHQMRVCCRRLRSDLRVFAPLVDPAFAAPVIEHVRWLGGVLGEPRDAEVLHARLHRTANADPLAPLDERAITVLDTDLTDRERCALHALAESMNTRRYAEILDALVEAARYPRLTAQARRPATHTLPRRVAKAWHHLETAAQLKPLDSDESWHAARIQAKRARYAAEAVAPAIGREASRLAHAVAGVQDVLGDHHDAVIAAQQWAELAERHPEDPAVTLTCGRLIERERAAARADRAQFDHVWARATRSGFTHWLRSQRS